MSSQNVFLIDMPDVVMRNILDYCDFYDIMKLRKTCRSLRNFIINTTPEKSIDLIEVDLYPNSVELLLITRKSSDYLTYDEYHGGCLVGWDRKNISMRNVDFMTAFSMDFKAILESNRAYLSLQITVDDSNDTKKTDFNHLNLWDILKIGFRNLFCPPSIKHENSLHETENQMFDLFESIWKRRRTPNRIDDLDLFIYNPDDVIKILPFIAPKALDELYIMGKSDEFLFLDMSEIIGLPVWKSLKKLTILQFTINIPLTSFLHMYKCCVRYEEICEQDLINLLEVMLNSKVKTQLIIYQDDKKLDSDGKSEVIKKLGLIYQEIRGNPPWHIDIPNTNLYVHIGHWEGSICVRQEYQKCHSQFD